MDAMNVEVRRRCPRCGAPAGPDDRFCAVCGAASPTALPTGERGRRGRWLLVGSAVFLLAIFAAVAWIYYSSPERRTERPVSHLPNGAPSALAILPGSPSNVVVAAGGKLLISQDRGGTWQAAPLEGMVGTVATSPVATGTAYLAGSSLWRGNLRGFRVVATDLPTNAVRALVVDPADSRRVYALVAGQGLYRSDDDGQQW